MIQEYIKRLGAVLVISILLLVSIPACSQGAVTQEQIPVKEQVTEKITTKIGFLPITDHLILGVSEEKDNAGFKHLELDPIKFSDWATISEALSSGALDGAFLLAPLAFQTSLNEVPAKLVLLGHRDGSAIIVTTNGEVETAHDLEGKTVAIPHVFSTHNMLLHKHMKDSEVTGELDKVEMAPPEMPSALATEVIEGYIVAEPFGARGEMMGAGKILELSANIWEHHPDCVLVMREEYLRDNPEAVDELILSLIESGIFIEENREEAAKIGAQFLGQPEEALRKALLEPTERVTFYDLEPKVEEFAYLQNYMEEEMDLFPKKADLENFVDSSYAKKAYATIEE